MPDPKPVLTGLVFPESPRWHDGRLWVADWGAQQIVAVDLDGRREVTGHVASFPFSIDWRADGRLVVISAADRALLGEGPDGSLAPDTDLRGLSERPWNEIVVDGRGNIYLNNIGFDFPGGAYQPGFVALVRPDGTARVVADGLAFPNGMAVTPDNATLIVGESYASQLTAFDIAADGTLSGRVTWAETPGDHPDGICTDAEGAAWYADVGQRRCVRVAPGGEILQVVEFDRGCFACMLGGPDGRTLFAVTNQWNGPSATRQAGAAGQVLAVPAPAPAAGWP
ncbi:MAG TPA: SMP-30/gluconolactonase/LRE family protein [Streptosporangiaceae bacterium]